MPTFLHLTLAILTIASAASPPTSYSNHTVGDKAGWFFDSATNTSAFNYSSWAASQTFNLGDFLIFNTNSNQSVIHTFNDTTFKSCSTDDDSDNDDTIQYGGGSTAFGEPLTIAVPLVIEGSNYFFSDADDGFQCEHGLAFEIQVNHGLGLPPSLNQPPPPPYKSPPGPQSPPITIPVGSESESETPSNSGCGFNDDDYVRVRRFAVAAVCFAVASIAVY
ncbi:early nodulin-like protein 18 [Euphorbia lathyris]|uniref:early nodulin-like protein 18 n=1 Tax=Euphorbia lathyris TaxID=212925 RepID=UPI00331446FC